MSEKNNVVNDSSPADTSSIPYLMCIGKQVGKEFLWPKIKKVLTAATATVSIWAKRTMAAKSLSPFTAPRSARPALLPKRIALPSARAWILSRPKPP